MQISPPLVAHLQAPKAIQPTQDTLDDPAMLAQPFARFDPAPGDPWPNPACPQPLPIGLRVIGFVGVQLGRTASRRGRRIVGMASTSSSNMVVSCMLAPMCRIANGVPRPSTIRWRFDPALPRSVGLRPVFWPPLARVHSPRPARPASSQCGRHGLSDPAGPDGGCPRHRRYANHAAGANRSSRCHSPFLAARTPTGCRF